MQQGRRTASLKASYEAINSGSGSFNRTSDISSINRELSGAAQTAIAAAQQTHKRHRRCVAFFISIHSCLLHICNGAILFFDVRKRGQGHSNTALKSTSLMNQTAPADLLEESVAMEADPDDPRYCICNEVAYGDMVACDNANVSIP